VNVETTSKTPKRKVVASTAGGLSGIVIADFANWGVNELFFAPDAYPDPVSGFVTGLCVGGFAFLAGYFVKSAPGE